MKPLILTYPPTAYTSVLYCPVCGEEIHREEKGDRRGIRAIAEESESRCVVHLRERHRLRFWLWRRLRWDWLIRGRS